MLAKESKCDKCKISRVLKRRFRDKNAKERILNWRCGSTSSLFNVTFFQLFRKPLNELLLIIKCWAVQLTIAKAEQVLKIEKSKYLDKQSVICLIIYAIFLL